MVEKQRRNDLGDIILLKNNSLNLYQLNLKMNVHVPFSIFGEQQK